MGEEMGKAVAARVDFAEGKFAGFEFEGDGIAAAD
jgi:hypothetical protein